MYNIHICVFLSIRSRPGCYALHSLSNHLHLLYLLLSFGFRKKTPIFKDLQCFQESWKFCIELPEAFLHGNENNPCITGKWHECSINGIEHLHWNFRDRSAGHLWQMVAYAIWKNREGKAERSITDELMELVASQVTGELDPIFPKKDIYT